MPLVFLIGAEQLQIASLLGEQSPQSDILREAGFQVEFIPFGRFQPYHSGAFVHRTDKIIQLTDISDSHINSSLLALTAYIGKSGASSSKSNRRNGGSRIAVDGF